MEDGGQQFVYGRNAVTELLKSAGADTVLISDGMDPKTAAYYTALAKQAGAVPKRVRAEKLASITDGAKHQGVLAYTSQIEYCELGDILQAARGKGEAPFLLLCDGVEDPHNLGALIRSALLCGAHGVVIPKRGSAAVTPVVMKASAGAAARLPVARVSNLGQAVRTLKEENVFVYCAHMNGTPLPKQDLSGPIALVMGAEGSGVSSLVQKLCDGAVCLPMQGGTGVDSFNVSVAGGILMHHIFMVRQP